VSPIKFQGEKQCILTDFSASAHLSAAFVQKRGNFSKF